MGFLSNLLIGGAGAGAKNVMEGVGSLAKDLRSAITGELDPDKRAGLEAKALALEAEVTIAQLRINEAEAGHASIFVAGWRPAAGWTCVIALFYHFIINRLLTWACSIWWPDIIPPEFDITALMTILLGMLGLGFSRSYEKAKGVQDKH